ncbi:hypothetical protein [Yoonia sp.]|uniref:hypothetical protein n=1 Tax=Yoonia sp. TaxID=2212373 RepID=UPI00358ECA53
MKNLMITMAVVAALPGFAMAQSVDNPIRDNDDNNIVDGAGVDGNFNDNDTLADADNSVLVQAPVDGNLTSLEDSLNDNKGNVAQEDLFNFDDIFDVEDDFVDGGNFNIADKLISIDDITLINLSDGISSAIDGASVAGTVMSATAVNIADVDGSINIASIGQSASAANDAADTAVSIAAGAGTLSYESASAAIDGGLGAGNLFSGETPKLELTNLELAGNKASEAADLAVIAGQYTRNEVTSSAESTVATIQEFGDVASVAAGALNTATFEVSETAGETVASSAGETLTTLANATDSLTSGSGLLVSADALNSALINGSITAELDGGDVTFTSISSVAAGALNTVTVEADLVGRVSNQIQY